MPPLTYSSGDPDAHQLCIQGHGGGGVHHDSQILMLRRLRQGAAYMKSRQFVRDSASVCAQFEEIIRAEPTELGDG